MIAEPHTCCSFCCKLSLNNEDKLVRDLLGAFIKSSNTSTSFPAIFQAETPTLALALALSSIKELC